MRGVRAISAEMKLLFGILAAVLLWQKSCVLGKLTVLQDVSKYDYQSGVYVQGLTCISEDDSSALVWVQNLKYHKESDSRIIFKDSSTKRSTIDCAFDGKDDCSRGWNQASNWNITNSYNTPMGSVMDRRWEGFPEFFSNVSDVRLFERINMRTTIFSILGTVDLRIAFCVSSTPDSRCYWIGIGVNNSAESFIRKFKRDSKFHDAQRIPGTKCQTPQVLKHAQSSLSLVEWKTLTVKHSGRRKVMEVYDEVQLILACNYTENIAFNWIGLQTPARMLLRLHDYDFIHTTVEHEQLLSPWLYVVDSNICLEMVVGLCTGCKLTMNMISEKGHRVMMGNVLSKSSSNEDGLPSWQHVTFKTSVQNNFGSRVRFQVLTRLMKYDPSPLWAVASITKCKDDDAVRVSTMERKQVWNEKRNAFTWPDINCQKLSHNGGSLVTSNRVYKHELKHDVPWCEEGKVGPLCATSCSLFYGAGNCYKLSICLADGCTCSLEWSGDYCDKGAREFLTAKVSAKGVVILRWFYVPETNHQIRKFDIIIVRIASHLLQESSQEKNSFEFHSEDTSNGRYTKLLYLLPSTIYRFSVCAQMYDKATKCFHMRASTPPALAFESEFKTAGNQSDHTIQVELPSISNVTSGSRMHIILKGEILCENRTSVSDVLISLIHLTDSESAWMTASFKMLGMKEQYFTIGDSRMYNGIFNCPLNPGETYDIVVIVEGGKKTTENMTIVSNILRVKLPHELKLPENYPTEPNLVWLISIPIIAALVLLTYYVYRKRNLVLSTGYDYITTVYNRTVNSDDSYVVPRERRGQVPDRPPPREESSHRSYLELATDTNSNPAEYEYISLVKIEKFEEYVKEAALTGLLEKEQAMLSRGPMKLSDYGKLPENESKNRNEDLVASDDETRVILKKLPGYPYSDYINASYIRGYNRVNAYIATQWPLLETLRDFWRMIWQEDVHNICLLSDVIEGGKRKYEQYWPEVGTERTYGEVIIVNTGHKVFANYTIRTLQLTYRQRTRKIKHLHYTARSDHDLPMYIHSVVTFLREVLALSLGDGPLVVQSGAGVGRNGIIILCDICLRRAAVEGVIDVYSEAEKLCKQSPHMLNNKQQYLLAHLAIAGCLVAPQTTLPCDASLPSKMQRMREQIDVLEKRLCDDAWQDNILRPRRTQKPLSAQDLAKNRYPEIAPDRDSRIFLKRYPHSDENSEYISAAYVDGVKFKKQYLATQLPLPSTLGDFWRMMAELEVELIVMLQEPDPQDSTCCEIIQCEKFNPVPHLTITTVTDCESDTKYYTRQKVQLSDSSGKPTRTWPVTILKCKWWECGLNGKPPSPNTSVALWLETEKISRGGPTAVVCHDGLTGCGLYLTMCFLLERMSVNRECDIYLAIRAVRRSRPEFMRTQEQMRFLHDAVEKYMAHFETYANFK